MGLSLDLERRCEMRCELCGATEGISSLPIYPKSGENDSDNIVACPKCTTQIQNSDNLDTHHLRCLTESIWSQTPSVQAISYRLLSQMPDESWAQDAIGGSYLDEETLEWAQSGEQKIIHKDSNGNILNAGDSVTLIQDLNVKGANFVAKRGTAVRRIRLVHDNSEHIEGKVDGQHIVILTKFVKKS